MQVGQRQEGGSIQLALERLQTDRAFDLFGRERHLRDMNVDGKVVFCQIRWRTRNLCNGVFLEVGREKILE